MPLAFPSMGGRLHPFYANPFRHADHVQVGRVDMGVDYHGAGRIDAIGKCLIIGDGGQGWPGGHYLLYKLLRGRHKGRYVYLAESVTPCVSAGQVVKKGRPVAFFGPDAKPGLYPGIETGWSSPTLNETLAAATEQPLPPDNANTKAGRCFARFLHRLGAPAPTVPRGPEYP
jgi:hypothetical protein